MSNRPKHCAPEEIVLQQVERISIPEFLERFANTTHRRLMLFVHKGTSCVNCGVDATACVFWKQKGNRALHVDLIIEHLWEDAPWHVMLMTNDHIIPVSKGGTDDLENRQPMCARCNERKGNKYDGCSDSTRLVATA